MPRRAPGGGAARGARELLAALAASAVEYPSAVAVMFIVRVPGSVAGVGTHTGWMDDSTIDILQQFFDVRSQQEAAAIARGHQGAATRSAQHLKEIEGAVVRMLIDAGLSAADVKTGHAGLPGHFRQVKNWDIAATYRRAMVGAVEFKSQSGSIGNNQNNRIEEVLGSGYDARSAHEVSELFGPTGLWLGYVFILVRSEDTQHAPGPRGSVVPSDPVFHRATYEDRYAIAIQRMLDRGLYDAAWFLVADLDPHRGVTYEEPVPAASRAVFETRLRARVEEVMIMRDGNEGINRGRASRPLW